ncbi:MerR family transcriptional regulator, partial [Plantactinospora mayteni]|uniref:helix-turn-helix domain-containing protein n=1 Tax=Plantactinospora mayteni TaxID=566021 RepID=UPI003CD0817F
MSDHDRRQKSRERNERDEREELLTIGALGRRTGLPVRTIRFWSDIGVAPPVGRSTSGYRLYDAGAVARLELVRTLRDLGFDLETVRRVLASGTTVREVAATHLRALDAEMTTHLGHERHAPVANANGNTRNGHSRKTLKGEFGALPIEVPRDREGSFEPQIVPKHQTRWTGFD